MASASWWTLLLYLRKLARRNLVTAHVNRVRVTASARVRHVDRVHCRTWVAGRSQIVDAVAVRADGDLGVTSREAFAVHAGVVLA